MSISINNSTLTKAQFDLQLRNLLERLEGREPRPYVDTASERVPTVGIGINLRVNANIISVFNEMGITSPVVKNALTAVFYDRSITTTAALQIALDAAYGAPFELTQSQIAATYATRVAVYVDQAQMKNSLPYSTELLALTSLHFNGLYGPQTIAALNLTDPFEARAEAWYQIRYEHIEGQNDKRRYAEAALFGLYEPGNVMTEAAARGVYRMYTAHANKMIDHDAGYESKLGGANLDLQAAGFTSRAATLELSLQAAADLLVTQ